MRVFLLVAVVLVVGCSGQASEVPDASADAGSFFDAGGFDAGATDAAVPDAGAADAGVLDAGVPDAGLVTATFTPSAAIIPNPERGWYVWASSDFGTSIDTGEIDDAFADGVRLAYAPTDLGPYRTVALPSAFLTQLGARLQALRSRGMKAVLRFSYDYSAGGNDAPATQIAAHLAQLAPVLTDNADAIAHFQAGFIGAWGEWHSSKHSNSYGYMTNAGVTQAQADANRLIVRDAIFAAVPADMQVQFRYPGDLIKWYPSATQQTRAGLHNDCWLSGVNDTGTYANAAERTYIATLSQNGVFGGETCDADTPLRTSCDDVRAEGARYHLAYLNSAYFEDFFTAWRSGGCYDEVTRQMGYRLQLDSVSHPARARENTTVRVEVQLRNVGWAKVFSARALVVNLQRRQGAARIEGRSTVLLPTLAAQATTSTTISIDVQVPAGAVPGDYDVSFSVPDVQPRNVGDARFAVRFANADAGPQSWNATRAQFDTGTSLVIE